MRKRPHNMRRIYLPAVMAGLFYASAVWSMSEHPAAAHTQTNSCTVGGCSGQLCLEASQGDMVSTCEFRAEYACYKTHGECTRQPDGRCGWTPVPALKRCLSNPPALMQ